MKDKIDLLIAYSNYILSSKNYREYIHSLDPISYSININDDTIINDIRTICRGCSD